MSNKLKVKPVVVDKHWIIHKQNQKIGDILQNRNGRIQVVIKNNKPLEYKSVDELKQSDLFEFTEIHNNTTVTPTHVLGYPTNGPAFNAMWNLKNKLPLYTLEADSKSWYAAGYYTIKYDTGNVDEFCPKLITLQRNKYSGPFVDKPLSIFDQLYEEL